MHQRSRLTVGTTLLRTVSATLFGPTGIAPRHIPGVIGLLALGVGLIATPSAAQLGAAGNQFWNQDSPGLLGGAEARDFFGTAVAAGDFENDGYDDLAIGIYKEDIGAIVDAGAVQVLYGGASGLSATGNQLWFQNSPGIKDGSETGDSFGRSLAGGDFDGDGYGDLAIGVAGEDF